MHQGKPKYVKIARNSTSNFTRSRGRLLVRSEAPQKFHKRSLPTDAEAALSRGQLRLRKIQASKFCVKYPGSTITGRYGTVTLPNRYGYREDGTYKSFGKLYD
jgi:hypothetical protein